MCSQFHSLIRFGSISWLVCWLVVTWQTQAVGQIPLAPENNSSTNLPPLGVLRYGSIEVTWVESPLNRQKLFQIAAPTVIDRSNLEGDRLPVEVRAENIEALLWLAMTRLREDLFSNLFDLKSSQIVEPATEVLVSTLNNRPVIQVKSKSSHALTIATVTGTDSVFYSQTSEQIARNWQEIIQAEISQVEYLSSPHVIRTRLAQAIAILLGILAASGILGWIYWFLGRSLERLQQTYDELSL